MKLRPTAEQRAEMLLASSQLEQPLEATNAILLAAAGVGARELTQEQRVELLAKCMAGELVELYLELDAYEQRDGERNRGCVRLSPGAIAPAARSAKGRPFLRDHRQDDTLARGGEIVEAKSVKRGEGDYVIRMTVRLTALWAVELALRDLLSFISIGLRAIGPVLCSCCGTEVFTECWHYRGQEVVTKAGGEPQICEWIYTKAEIVEASSVNVPAVVGAHIESIRAALSALDLSPQDKEPRMKNLPKLLAALNLAATAGEDEILTAVEEYNRKAKATEAELGIKAKDLEVATAERDALKSAQLASEAKAFIDEAIGLGQIAPADQETWSTLYSLDKDKAVKLMADRKPGTATPVGRPRQTAVVTLATAPTAAPVITGGETRARKLTFQGRVAAQLSAAKALLSGNELAQAFAADVFGYRGEVGAINLAATSISNNDEFDAARIGFQAAMLEAVVGEASPVQQLATEVASNKAEESYKWLGDLPSMEEWKNDRIMAMLEGYGFSIRNKKWQATLRVKNDDFKDDALGLLPATVSQMGEQARLQPSELLAALILNGFAGADSSIGDGLAFDGAFYFSTAHATGSNKLTVVFSATNLALAGTMLRQQKRFDGKNLRAQGSHLFVGVDNEALAEKVLTQEMLTGGESNTQRGKYKLVVVPEFTAGEWFLADLRGPIKPLIFQNREGVTTTTVGGSGQSDPVGFQYDETWFGAQARNNAGYLDFRRMIGSKP